MERPADILQFWFDRPPDESGEGNARKVWFKKSPDFDREVRMRFLSVYDRAIAGQLDDWKETPEGCLALVIVLDQFPRNMYRGQPQSFATDAKALAIAETALNRGFDQCLPPVQRWFLYIPFMHSENLEHQRRSVQLFSTLKDDPDVASAYPFAIRHQEVVERFGRFPHRNDILGRENTPEEAEFLKQPGSSF
jgi:uncharacterized protein (DUF924 family)